MLMCVQIIAAQRRAIRVTHWSWNPNCPEKKFIRPTKWVAKLGRRATVGADVFIFLHILVFLIIYGVVIVNSVLVNEQYRRHSRLRTRNDGEIVYTLSAMKSSQNSLQYAIQSCCGISKYQKRKRTRRALWCANVAGAPQCGHT